MKGVVLNIERASLHDGPGIRTTVFLKGCNLSCIWCHNPESRRLEPQLFYKNGLCIMCRKCQSVCENGVHSFQDHHNIDFSKCRLCGKCIEQCPTKSLTVVGKVMPADEIMQAVLKDKPFYEYSGGGLTISGGEPMGIQADFTYDLLEKAKNCGINTAVETSGFGKKTDFEKIYPYVDYFLFDYKTDRDGYRKYTGVEFSVIENNLKLLDQAGSCIILRCPVIPTVNDTEEHMINIAKLTERFSSVKSVELLFYNTFGISKGISIGEDPVFVQKMPDAERKKYFIEKLKKMVAVPVK